MMAAQKMKRGSKGPWTPVFTLVISFQQKTANYSKLPVHLPLIYPATVPLPPPLYLSVALRLDLRMMKDLVSPLPSNPEMKFYSRSGLLLLLFRTIPIEIRQWPFQLNDATFAVYPWSLGAASSGGTQSVIARRRRAAACRNSLQYYTTAW